MGIGYNDNLTGALKDRVSSVFLLASPRVRAEVKSGGDTYALAYSGNFGHHLSTSDITIFAVVLNQQDFKQAEKYYASTSTGRSRGYGGSSGLREAASENR